MSLLRQGALKASVSPSQMFAVTSGSFPILYNTVQQLQTRLLPSTRVKCNAFEHVILNTHNKLLPWLWIYTAPNFLWHSPTISLFTYSKFNCTSAADSRMSKTTVKLTPTLPCYHIFYNPKERASDFQLWNCPFTACTGSWFVWERNGICS